MYVSTVLTALAHSFTLLYGLDIKTAYPDVVMEYAAEPIARLLAYVFVYMVSIKDPIAGVAVLIAVLLIHYDYLNLGREEKK